MSTNITIKAEDLSKHKGDVFIHIQDRKIVSNIDLDEATVIHTSENKAEPHFKYESIYQIKVVKPSQNNDLDMETKKKMFSEKLSKYLDFRKKDFHI